MRVFVDLGAYNGDTLSVAMAKYKDFDRFYAFEPLRENFALLEKRFGNARRVVLINAAADVTSGKGTLFLGKGGGNIGGSLCADKSTCYSDRTEEIERVDFSEFMVRHFALADKVVLKVDIEGKEYELLRKMMDTGSLRYVSSLYCEWHYDRIRMDYSAHRAFVRKLRRSGHGLSGYNATDEFAHVASMQSIELKIWRGIYYYFYAQAATMKNRVFRA